jgi:hypothetical protein
MHRLLIAGQLALTLLLMTGAGAAIKAFKALTHTPLGFDPDNVFALDVNFPRGSNPTWQERMQAQETIRKAMVPWLRRLLRQNRVAEQAYSGRSPSCAHARQPANSLHTSSPAYQWANV